jgi:hypothetical protein
MRSHFTIILATACTFLLLSVAPPPLAWGQVRRAMPTATVVAEDGGEEYYEVEEYGVEEDVFLTEEGCGDPGCRVLEPCCGLPLNSLWWEADYLLWWTKGMAIPPLVTGGSSGALDASDLQILYGDSTILDDARSGFRVGLGSWLDPGHCWGIEGDYWMLGDATDHFRAASNAAGAPSLFRPFFNVNPRDENGDFAPPAREDAEIVSTPEVLAGSVDVDSYSELLGAGFRFRRQLYCETECVECGDPCGDPCCAPVLPRSSRLDFLIGYRYAQLREGIQIRESLSSLLPAPEQGNFAILDDFATTNSFHGADLGVTWQRRCGPWRVDLLGKLALGGVEQSVVIDGQTTISGSVGDNGTFPGGLLAQETNIGTHRRRAFAMIPELGISLGYQLTPCLSARVGYNLFYWSRVVRPGEVIDLDVNPDLLPPQESVAGAMRPRFEWQDTDFWAQGLRVGLECVW